MAKYKKGAIIAWSNDDEVAEYASISDAAKAAGVSEKELSAALGTDTEIRGVTYFKYGIDEEATKCYNEARAEADAIGDDDN